MKTCLGQVLYRTTQIWTRYKAKGSLSVMLVVFGSGVKIVYYTLPLFHVAQNVFFMGAEWHLFWPSRDQYLNSSLPIGSVWGTRISEAGFISWQSRSIVSFPKSAHYFLGRCPAPFEAVSLQTLRVWWDESHPWSFRACLHCTLRCYLWYKLVSSYIMVQKS